MLCPNCHAELSNNMKFCTKCGTPLSTTTQSPAPQQQYSAPVQPAAPQQQYSAPVQPAAPQQQYSAPVQPAVPVQSYSEAPAKARRKFNPLAIIIPVVSVAVLAAVGLVLYFLLFSKPAVTIDDLENALAEQDYRTAFEISEQLPSSDCEKVIEDYITELLDADSDDLEKNQKAIRKMFSKGFDKYKKIYKNYQNGNYSPDNTDDNNSSQPDSSSAESEQNDTASSAPSTDVSTIQSEAVTSTPETSVTPEYTAEADIPEPPLYERVAGHWRREVRTGYYEDIVFLEDGTGYIYSDIVSEKPSATNPKYMYHDGKIHFNWWTDEVSVHIDADIDPYCFVAYQGYAAPGHYSSATWKGSKNGSHDYYFGYKTQEEYLCDMLGIKKTSELYSGESLTGDFWASALNIFDNAWDIYFYHKDQYNDSRYPIDYKTLADSYYNNPSLRAKYEDVDLYHFVEFTKMVLIGTGNPTTVSLEFDMEDYYRAE